MTSDDSEPQDYEKERIQAMHSMGPNTLEDLHAVPIEALEELADAWEQQASEGTGEIGTSTYLKTRSTYYRRCAKELPEVIADYE